MFWQIFYFEHAKFILDFDVSLVHLCQTIMKSKLSQLHDLNLEIYQSVKEVSLVFEQV